MIMTINRAFVKNKSILQITRTELVCLFLLFLSPILSFPGIVYLIYKGSRKALYFLAFFLALVAYLSPPIWDLYRHNVLYYQMQTWTIPYLLLVFSSSGIIAPLTSYFLGYYELSFQWQRFIFTFIELSCLFWLFLQQKEFPSKSYKIYFLLLVIAGYNFYWAIESVRGPLAMCLFLLGSFNLVHNRKIVLSLFLLILSSLTHTFYIMISVIALMIWLIDLKLKQKTVLIYCAIALILGTTIILYLNQILLEYVGIGASEKYTSGFWAQDQINNQGLNSLIYYQIKRFWFLPMLLFFLINYTKDRFSTLISIISMIYLGTFTLWTINERISDLLCMLLIFNYIYRYKKVKYGFRYAVFVSMSIYLLAIGVRRRFILMPQNNFYHELFVPLPFILQKEQYSLDWINQNLIDDDFKNK